MMTEGDGGLLGWCFLASSFWLLSSAFFTFLFSFGRRRQDSVKWMCMNDDVVLQLIRCLYVGLNDKPITFRALLSENFLSEFGQRRFYWFPIASMWLIIPSCVPACFINYSYQLQITPWLKSTFWVFLHKTLASCNNSLP